ncbi:MAG: 50S ribosomal protein L22 [Thermoanaerobaculum sp.]|nr:50S ribosomal protein L22 [Thermoanaerobaculum sp.]MDW7966755.1 50S ribosomal protein L22 [Thermoanaerobaculum sp.]
MEARALLRYYRGSAQKVRLVANLIRGQQVTKALATLRLTQKRCARDLEKLLKSAVANLEQKSPGIDSGRLVVRRVTVDQGPAAKRFRAGSMGRAFRRLRRTCHILLEVADLQS